MLAARTDRGRTDRGNQEDLPKRIWDIFRVGIARTGRMGDE